jgi:DNA polymerase sigma
LMTTSSTFTSPSDIDLIVRYFIYKFCTSARKCLSDRYFKANIVYLVYSLLLLHIDVNIGRESASDTMYILLGYVHILNGEKNHYCSNLTN